MTGRPRESWAGPVLRLVHSPSDSVEIDLEWTARVGQRDDPDFGSVSDWGDVALRAKVRFVDEGRGHPAIGARFGVLLPETSFGNGLGPNALRMSAQILASQAIGGVTLHGNAGLALHDEVFRTHEQRDFLAYGLEKGCRGPTRTASCGVACGWDAAASAPTPPSGEGSWPRMAGGALPSA
ncbi:MAG: hypothetical protein DMF77_13865 [Acidobacteria bacterium]|nr:MAG: hypothetical protein DMF77_13865 [Acidobacteriota bacterium]